jgi:hypothetical protein
MIPNNSGAVALWRVTIISQTIFATVCHIIVAPSNETAPVFHNEQLLFERENIIR